MNSQQLNLIKEMCEEKLDGVLDAKHRSMFGSILAQVKEQIKVLDAQEKRENRTHFNTQVDEMHEQQCEDLRLNKC